MMSLAGGAQPIDVKQYRRLDGLVDLPAQVQVKSVVVKVMDNSASKAVRATQTLKL
jgi:hypothetical protein